MKIKINDKINIRKYKDKNILLPEGDKCFIGYSIVYSLYNITSNWISVEEVKTKLLSKYHNKIKKNKIEEIQRIIDKMLEKDLLLIKN